MILRKIIKIAATRCHILKLKCTKFDFGWGSATDPAGGTYSAPPGSIAGFKGLATSKGKDGKEGTGGKGGEERTREGRKGARREREGMEREKGSEGIEGRGGGKENGDRPPLFSA